jgi:hypothetical protein
MRADLSNRSNKNIHDKLGKNINDKVGSGFNDLQNAATGSIRGANGRIVGERRTEKAKSEWNRRTGKTHFPRPQQNASPIESFQDSGRQLRWDEDAKRDIWPEITLEK